MNEAARVMRFSPSEKGIRGASLDDSGTTRPETEPDPAEIPANP